MDLVNTPTIELVKRVSARSLLLCCALPLILLPLADFFAVSPVGTSLFLSLRIVLFVPFLLALIALPVSLFYLISKTKRKVAGKIAAASVVLIVSVYLGGNIGALVRMHFFEKLAVRSAPLVEAVGRYHEEHGVPPDTLEALVPSYLPEIPGTGMMVYPEYEYFTGDAAHAYGENPWVLSVFAPSGGINFDQFLYFPRQNYPETGYGGWLRPVRDWAYLHE